MDKIEIPASRFRDPVTAIIPTYNRQDTVCEAVDSVLSQSHPDCMALVVDDGSTDQTARRIAERFGGNVRVRYHRMENAGVSAARNVGVGLADSELIAFLDSDDIWHPQKIALQVACFKALGRQVDAIWTDMHDISQCGARTRANSLRASFGLYKLVPLEKLFPFSRSFDELAIPCPAHFRDTRIFWGDIAAYLMLGNMCRPSAMFLTRQRFYRAGPFNESIAVGEDHEFHIRLMAAGPGACIDTALIDYRTGGDDQLSRPENELLLAESLLATIVPMIRSGTLKLPVPQSVLRKKCAFPHFWYARESLRHGRVRIARHHFVKGLLYSPMDLRAWKWLLATGLPRGLLPSLGIGPFASRPQQHPNLPGSETHAGTLPAPSVSQVGHVG